MQPSPRPPANEKYVTIACALHWIARARAGKYVLEKLCKSSPVGCIADAPGPMSRVCLCECAREWAQPLGRGRSAHARERDRSKIITP